MALQHITALHAQCQLLYYDNIWRILVRLFRQDIQLVFADLGALFLDTDSRVEQDVVSTKRTLRGTFGSGGEPPRPPLHPGFYALVRHMARVAAERDYKRFLEDGIQPDGESENKDDN